MNEIELLVIINSIFLAIKVLELYYLHFLANHHKKGKKRHG
jgi:hypothetical protein